MIVLDLTVVNIALPSIARGLHFSAPSLAWVLNAYSLTFGGLLLLGGRASDILGRRRMFISGIAVFTAASLAGSLATSAAWLLAARAVQGIGGAIASPAVLATIVSGFPEGRERTRALSIFTAVMMGGASLGLVLGGMITEWASWRWVLFINVPIGVAVILAARHVLPESARQPGRFDIVGAMTSTAGMSALVYAFIRAASSGWADRLTLVAFAVAAALLAEFVLTEVRSPQPITPLRLFADRSRSASYVARLLLVAGMFGMFFFLTQYIQEILGFSPLQAGIAFVPLTMASLAGVRPEDSGSASSMVNVTQQVGGALGLAILVTVFGSTAKTAVRHPVPGAAGSAATALTHAMASSFGAAAIFDVCALVVIMLAIRMLPTRVPASSAPRAMASTASGE